ncbi:protein FAM227A isoform X1 [Mauremys mutica]|uniref:protein FAM227A isoform X1 n=1 Tax=Mauremys mutica TaxID=74926 RepID=UPI001D154DF3|nr:protein FAM227A isoform X1 [Mauremys mutica]XP_044841208.1 protein FAM227A isoform X1 [Mauremys mutica]XP_044841216.1 protein FAM227A isoform X1 [Mauremys mutica]XP_044841224.1 protein FAM227A isoform X1 [Mauremys mutica]XP_044841233.1 protein FAM227A isoform X1 [Mauremys mutica]
MAALHTSPMNPFQEFMGLLPLQQAKETEKLDMQQSLNEKPSLCPIGSMQKVNQKIAHLRLELEKFHTDDLVIEDLESLKRDSGQKSFRREKKHFKTSRDRDRDRKEICHFAQKYEHSMHASDLDPLSQPKLTYKKPQNTSEKNKLVELYQYPGYNEHEPTPLPNGTELAEVIEKVVCAQRKSASGKTPFPSKMLQKFLTTPVSQAILLDSFWWFFLHLYQPNREIQGRLFDRIAKNYAALLFDCHRFRYQNALIKVFPSLLSQTLYTCFCSSFPRSWFNTHEFKSQLCNVLSEWMAGTLPVPGSYSNWDYSHLEPERFRREDLLSTKGKQRRESCVPFASSKASGNPEKTPQPSIQPYKKSMSLGQTVNKYQPDQTSVDLDSKEVVHASMSLKGINPHTMPHDLQPEKDDLKSTWKQPQHTFETRRLKIAPFHRESHPACQGPDFTWHLFNINGHSPLIQHFLQSYNVEPQSGQDILIHRREICKPIPTESTPTYADVIRQSFNNIRHLDNAFKRVHQRHCREMKDFDQHQWKEKQEFLRKEKQLLSEKGEMKKLNQLLTPRLDVLFSSDKT